MHDLLSVDHYDEDKKELVYFFSEQEAKEDVKWVKMVDIIQDSQVPAKRIFTTAAKIAEHLSEADEVRDSARRSSCTGSLNFASAASVANARERLRSGKTRRKSQGNDCTRENKKES